MARLAIVPCKRGADRERIVTDHDLLSLQGAAPGAGAQVGPRILVRRLEALLCERQAIICELEGIAADDTRVRSGLLTRRLLQVVVEQARLLEDLDALIGPRAEYPTS